MALDRKLFRRLTKLIIVISFCLCVILSITVALIKKNSAFLILLLVLLIVCVLLCISGVCLLTVFRKFLRDPPRSATSDFPRGERPSPRRPFTISGPSDFRRTNVNPGDLDYEAPPPYHEALANSDPANLILQASTLYAAQVTVEDEEEDLKELASSLSDSVNSVRNQAGFDSSCEIIGTTSRDYLSTSDDSAIGIRAVASGSDLRANTASEYSLDDECVSMQEVKEEAHVDNELANPPPYPGEPEAFKYLRKV